MTTELSFADRLDVAAASGVRVSITVDCDQAAELARLLRGMPTKAEIELGMAAADFFARRERREAFTAHIIRIWFLVAIAANALSIWGHV